MLYNMLLYLLYHHVGKIVTEHGGNTKWTEHFIISSADISINATCRCSIGKPYWKKIDGTDLLEPDENTYCIDQGDMCDLETLTEKQPGRFVYRDLINFHANESTSLLCGNADQNYAPAITILISRKGKCIKESIDYVHNFDVDCTPCR